jgi:hypothetical protein
MKIIFSIIALGVLACIIKKCGFKNIVKTIEEKINPEIEQAAAQLKTPDTKTEQPVQTAQTTNDKQVAQTTQAASNTQTTQGNNTQAAPPVNEIPAPAQTLELPDHVKEFIARMQFKNPRLYSADSDDTVSVKDSSNVTFPNNTSTLAHDNISDEEEENDEDESGENYSNDNYNGGDNGGGGGAGNTPNLPVMPPLTPEQVATIGAAPTAGILSNILANPIRFATLPNGIHLNLPPIPHITPNLGGLVQLNTGAGATARTMNRRTNFKARRY